MKICSNCEKSKPIDDFHRNKDHRDGHNTICKSCKKLKYSLVGNMVSSAKSRAKKRNLAFNIDKEFITQLRDAQNNRCALSGIELNWKPWSGKKQRTCPPDRVSIDRIDPTKGYTKDNVQLLTDFANRFKSFHQTPDVIEFCKRVVASLET